MFPAEIPVLVPEVEIFLAVSEVKVAVVCFSVIFLAVSLPSVVVVDVIVVGLCRCEVASFVDVSMVIVVLSVSVTLSVVVIALAVEFPFIVPNVEIFLAVSNVEVGVVCLSVIFFSCFPANGCCC